jgi:curli production assembly/transport component CsgF
MKTLKMIFALLFLISVKTHAQDFIYYPKNPAFGGNPYNYSWLLSSAQAQNDIKETTTNPYSSYSTDPLKDFANSLNRQILSQLSRQIVLKQFGEDALSAGTYVLGDYRIEVGDQADGLNITIIDNKTGSQTTVSVPYF